jgi:hypothetical protein
VVELVLKIILVLINIPRSLTESVMFMEDGRSMLVFLEKDINLVLLIFNFMQLAVKQPCLELMQDRKRLPSSGDLMAR